MKQKKRFVTHLSLLMVWCVMLSMIGCGKDHTSNTEKKPADIVINTANGKAVALTAENYQDYLNMTIYCTEAGDSIPLNKPIALSEDYNQAFAYPTITGFLSTKTASSEISFKDVNLKLEITGTYRSCSTANIDEMKEDAFILTIETPIDASGEVTKTANFELPEGYTTITSYITYEYKIVEISGYVIK